MAQNSISSSPVPFFPDTSFNKAQSVSERNSARAAAASTARAGSESEIEGESQDAAATASFGKSLGAAVGKGDATKHSALALTTRTDKPKMGNREPFFPRTPMPYHPETSHTIPRMENATRESFDVRPSNDGVSDLGIEESRPRELPAMSAPSSSARTGFQMKSVNSDDDEGVMSDSYEGTAVSYPMRRIAPDLDEDTKTSLEQQGLWNLPTTVAAQPSPKLMSMAEAVEGSTPERSVPVQKPIAQFMASLENDLGVSPDRLVKAFEQLPPGAMQKPPEQTMVQVIKNLNLDAQETQAAMGLYSKMLAQIETMDRNEFASGGRLAVPAVVAGGLTTGKLEKQFETPTPMAKEVANRYARVDQSKSGAIKLDQDFAPVASKEVLPANLKEAGSSKTLSSDSKSLANFSEAPVLGASSEAGNKGQNFNFGQEQGQGGANQNQAQGQAFGSNAQTSQAFGSMKDEVKIDAKHGDLTSKAEARHVNPADLSSLNATNVNAQKPAVNFDSLQNSGALAGAGQAADGQARTDAKHEAIQSIINNAHMLAQKGGGEMHMTLKPDHMGEIQLRVAMNDGQVNVQMTTERGDVKKLIEQNVSELRHGLAQHNLSMQKLDVSVSDKNAGGNFSHGQPDFSAARDFSSQFQQHNQNRREMMSDLRGLGQGVRQPLARPAMVSTATDRSHLRSNSSMLDVVA